VHRPDVNVPFVATLERRDAIYIERAAAAHEAVATPLRKRLRLVLRHTTPFAELDDPEMLRQQFSEHHGWDVSRKPRHELEAYICKCTVLRPQQVGASCFPAGTPVVSAAGPVAIETLKPGDRVLAQDLKSGGLVFKTVQSPTLRRPVNLVEIRFSDSSIASTYGHPFWVVGKGWRVAGHLKPGDRLRALDRDLVVEHIEELPPREVYNLLVSDLATYFVGSQRLLVHDDSRVTGAPVLLPGLAFQSKQ
jgi:hypothetical protein